MMKMRNLIGLAGLLVIVSGGILAYILWAPHTDAVQQKIDVLTKQDGVPGVLISMQDRDRDTETLTSGVADIDSKQKMVDAQAHYRIASLTKPIIAATLVQLSGEQKVDFNAPVERYLPGMVRGTGSGATIDGRQITVRQLLQHTSGLPDFVDDVDPSKGPFNPEDFVRIALAKAPTAELGKDWSYSNTNYVLAGMIIEKVTGQTYQAATEARVLKPLGMSNTYSPEKGDLGIKDSHAKNYTLNDDSKLEDLTEFPGYDAGASGGLISTPQDMNIFWQGLFAQKLFPQAQLDMMTTQLVDMPFELGQPAKSQYGLGIVKGELSCGGSVWLHGGDLPMITTLSGRDASNHTATIYATSALGNADQRQHLLDAFDTAFCSSR